MADPVRLISAAVRDRARCGELAHDGPAGAVRKELRRYAEHAVASGAPQIADERQVIELNDGDDVLATAGRLRQEGLLAALRDRNQVPTLLG